MKHEALLNSKLSLTYCNRRSGFFLSGRSVHPLRNTRRCLLSRCHFLSHSLPPERHLLLCSVVPQYMPLLTYLQQSSHPSSLNVVLQSNSECGPVKNDESLPVIAKMRTAILGGCYPRLQSLTLEDYVDDDDDVLSFLKTKQGDFGTTRAEDHPRPLR
jgi:hypothetical protein